MAACKVAKPAKQAATPAEGLRAGLATVIAVCLQTRTQPPFPRHVREKENGGVGEELRGFR